MATIEMYRDRAGGYRWRLRSANHEILADGAAAQDSAARCRDAVDAFRSTAPAAPIADVAPRSGAAFVVAQDAGGRWRWGLLDQRHATLADSGQGYRDRWGVTAALATVAAVAPTATLMDRTSSAGASPIAVFTVTPAGGPAPLVVTLDGSGSSDPDGVVTAWDWSAGGAPIGSGQQLEHTLQEAGSVTLGLTVADDAGNTGSAEQAVVVEAPGTKLPSPGRPAADQGDGWVALSWEAVEGAVAYVVEWRRDDRPEDAPQRTETGISRYLHEGAQNGAVYRYAVRAKSAKLESDPSPEVVARPFPPVDPAKPGMDLGFLHEGGDPVQRDVGADAIDPRRAGAVRGRVVATDGTPVGGVRVSVDEQAEAGWVATRPDGGYEIALNGGAVLTLGFDLDGYVPVRRVVSVGWADLTSIPDVVMTAPDAPQATVDLGGGTVAAQVVETGQIVDDDGARRAALVIPPATSAQRISMHTAAEPAAVGKAGITLTELTVGPAGARAMPAELPPTSTYTYAVNIDVEGAATGDSVRFSAPIVHYVDNFLGLPVGGPVPVAHFDAGRGAWVADDDGRIVAILGVEGAHATVDVDGSGKPASAAALAELGIDDEERAQLATLFEAGTSLWRVQLAHLSTHDYNWPADTSPAGTSPDASRPQPDPPKPDCPERPDCKWCGSTLDLLNQAMGESLVLAGTPYELVYRSEMAAGRRSRYAMDIPLIGAEVPTGLRRIVVEVIVAGRRERAEYAAAPNQEHHFVWDGRDAFGRPVPGRQPARIRIGYVYPRAMQQPVTDTTGGRSFGEASGEPIEGALSRLESTIWQEAMQQIGAGWELRTGGLGGWTLDVLSPLDPAGSQVAEGDDGPRMVGELVRRTVEPLAGGGRSERDGGPAVEATAAALNDPIAVAVDARGRVLFVEDELGQVYAIDEGRLRLVAGSGKGSGPLGDGGPAVEARLLRPVALRPAPDGSLLIADAGGNRVRRVRTDGLITTVAGTGRAGGAGAGGPASKAQLNFPAGVDVERDGSILIADSGNQQIRRVSPDGRITTAAGSTEAGAIEFEKGAPAASVRIGEPIDVVVHPSGGFAFIAEQAVYRVDGYGRMSLLAGGGERQPEEADQAARWTFDKITALAIAPDASVQVADQGAASVVRIATLLDGDDIKAALPSSDGSLLYHYVAGGLHAATTDVVTGRGIRTFEYTPGGALAAVAEDTGATTTVKRDADGAPTAIVGPFGHRTELSCDGRGRLVEATAADGAVTRFDYDDGGLMTAVVDPTGGTRTYAYDDTGRLVAVTDPEGRETRFARKELDGGFEVLALAASGSETVNRMEYLPAQHQYFGAEVDRRTIKGPCGRTTVEDRTPVSLVTEWGDGTRTNAKGRVTEPTQFADRTGEVVLTTPKKRRYNVATARTVTRAGSRVQKITDELTVMGGTRRVVIDVAKRTLTTTTPMGRVYRTGYDERWRIATVQGPGGPAANLGYDELDRLTSFALDGDKQPATYTYGADGGLARVDDPRSGTTVFTYDAAGRPTSVKRGDGPAVTTSYDALGRPVEIAREGQAPHRYTWGLGDQLRSATLPPVPGEPDHAVGYGYDDDGRLARVTGPGGRAVDFAYDPAGRLLSASAGGAALTSLTYRPKESGPRTTTANGISIANEYDGNLLLRRSWTGRFEAAVELDVDRYLRPGGRKVGDRPLVPFLYDDEDRVRKIGDLQIKRDEKTGAIAAVELKATTEQRTYDELGNFAGLTVKHGATALYATKVELDVAGRIVSEVERTKAGERKRAYAYDELGRLASVDDSQHGKWTYAYDAGGNSIERRLPGGAVETGRSDERDRLVTLGDLKVRHDANGAVEAISAPAGETRIERDALGRIVSTTLPDEKAVRYLRDADGRPTVRSADGEPDRIFLWVDGGHPVAELDTNGKVVSHFLYASRTATPDLIVRTDGKTFRCLCDVRGSVRLVVDAHSGEVAQELEYDPYGRVIADSNPGFQPFGFCGGLHDPATGIVRLGERDYHPLLGRWLSLDPNGVVGSTNLYEYAAGDPVNFTDPSGGWATLALAAMGAVASLALDAYSQSLKGGGYDPAELALAGASGAVLGAVGANPAIGALQMALYSGVVAAVQAGMTKYFACREGLDCKPIDAEFIAAAAIGVVSAGAFGGVGARMGSALARTAARQNRWAKGEQVILGGSLRGVTLGVRKRPVDPRVPAGATTITGSTVVGALAATLGNWINHAVDDQFRRIRNMMDSPTEKQSRRC